MIRLLYTLLFLPFFAQAQQKISGTVTFHYPGPTESKADKGANIYVLDKRSAEALGAGTIDSFIKGHYYYGLFRNQASLRARPRDYKWNMNSRILYDEYKPAPIPDEILAGITRYHAGSKAQLDSLDERCFQAVSAFSMHVNVMKTTANPAGNYLIPIKQPGTYYVLIQSAHGTANAASSKAGKLYIEETDVEEGRNLNVSTHFILP